jgi:hypothetical protein
MHGSPSTHEQDAESSVPMLDSPSRLYSKAHIYKHTANKSFLQGSAQMSEWWHSGRPHRVLRSCSHANGSDWSAVEYSKTSERRLGQFARPLHYVIEA